MNINNLNLKKIKEAWLNLAFLEEKIKNQIILEIADNLAKNELNILSENQKDIKNTNTSEVLLDRLVLNTNRLQNMIENLRRIAQLPDPLKINNTEWTLVNKLKIQKIRVPIGLLLVVYEARPNVTTDTIALALKSGNAAILKGSRQTTFTNTILAKYIQEVLYKYNLNNCFEFLSFLSEEESIKLISDTNLDLIIPRGGENLKKFINKYANAPVLGAGGGLCHAYISNKADLQKAKQIILNGKTQRPAVCNSLETVLIHQDLLTESLFSEILEPLINANVEIKADQNIYSFCNLNNLNKINSADETDWSTEYLSLTLSIKTVNSLNEAIQHINKYSTGHSEVIITEDQEESIEFCQKIDSACVYVNASTRFTDGEEFGFGAEIGISTQKLHARGPIGLNELTTYKYLIHGNGQIR